MKHANISVFVPHLGCPNDCSFCNQRHITGQINNASISDVHSAVAIAKTSKNYNPKNTEIAFFGGSFTAICRNDMLSLLETAYKYVADGSVSGVRISTRPDYIDEEILSVLKQYGVTAIELGAQSLDDEVLKLNNRGHSALDVFNASELIKNSGFSLGLQMMTGLFGDTDEGAIKTAKQFIELKPDTVRIYPTIVLKNTRLATLFEQGVYKPQNLDSAVHLCAVLQEMFASANINVIRTGLHSIDSDSYIAGPWHPAFSELCESRRFLIKILEICKVNKIYDIYVNPTDISKFIGQKKSNLEALKLKGYNINFIQDKEIERNSFKCKEVKQG